jgi:hypothetical protein
VAAILSLSADSVSGIVFPVIPAGSGAKVIVISGKGGSTLTNGGTSTGIIGDCKKVRVIAASAGIGNGTGGNTITATARCGNLVVPETATDPGLGGVSFESAALEQDIPPGQNAAGPLSCAPTYLDGGPMVPDSQWTVTCTFLFFPG